LRYTNGAEPKAATIASNEPAWLKNSLTEATSVMSMPGEELRELAKVRVANTWLSTAVSGKLPEIPS